MLFYKLSRKDICRKQTARVCLLKAQAYTSGAELFDEPIWLSQRRELTQIGQHRKSSVPDLQFQHRLQEDFLQDANELEFLTESTSTGHKGPSSD